MSLRVWLPLNGDLLNKGLDEITFSQNTGATINNNGKIGKCYSFDASNDWIQYSIDKAKYGNKPISLACWFKCDQNDAGGAILDLAADLCASYVYSNGEIYFRYWRCYSNSGTRTGDAYNTPNSYDAALWHHVAWIFNANINQIYVDGELALEVDSSSKYTTYWTPLLGTSYNKFSIGKSAGDSNWIGGMVNDVRIYDHALSLKLVKEISKGLVLHYPLDGGEIGGNPNILLNTHFDVRYNVTGWDTEKNGNLNASNWGGYNSGVSNAATVYHAHLIEFNNLYVYEYIRTTNLSWLGIWQNGLQDKLTAGTTYTFSWEEYHVEGTNRVGTGLLYYKPGATSANFHLGIQSDSSKVRKMNTWQRYTYTFVAPLDADWSKNMTWYVYGYYNNYGTFYLRHIKLLLGSLATEWIPNVNDSSYTSLGYGDSVVYDTSGYGNNGEIYSYDTYGTIEYTTDTPRHNISTFINSDNNTTNTASGTKYIYGHCSLTNPTAMSVAFWCKPLGGYGGQSGQGQFCTTNNEYGTSAGQDYQYSAMNHRDSRVDINDSASTTQCQPSFAPTLNEWHHYAITYDGQAGKVYRDAILSSTAQFSSPTVLDSFIGVIIGFSKAGGVWRSNKSYYSDFRLYCTCLSANDILLLYQDSALADKNNNFYTYEYDLQGYDNELLYMYDLQKSSSYTGTFSQDSDGLHINGMTWVYHDYIPINPSNKTFKYDITYSNSSGNKLYIGWERYDANKTSRSNNATIYVINGTTSTASYQRVRGTVDLSTDGVNPTAFIKLRILNKWTGSTDGTEGTTTIHSLSLKELTTNQNFDTININKQGVAYETLILEKHKENINANRSQELISNSFYEI